MTSSPLCHLVPSRRKGSSTSSISDGGDGGYTSSDDDSIGPLPILKRNKSLVVKRPSDHPETKRLPQARVPDYSSPHYPPPTRLRSLDVAPGRRSGPSLRHHTEVTEKRHSGGKEESMLSRNPPLRVQSLEPRREIHQDCKLLERHASMQPGAATQGSLSKRPDPPEEIRPATSLTQHRRGVLLAQRSTNNDAVFHDPFYRSESFDIPKQPRRITSMPLYDRGNIPRRSLAIGDKQEAANPDGMFSARRCKSIAKSVARYGGVDNDVWVERMVVSDSKDPKVFFKSVFSRECKSEPPTGALNVVYMDDLVKIQHLCRQHCQLSQMQQEEIAALAPVVKKRGLWGKAKSKKKAGETSSGHRRTWKSSIGFGSGRKKKVEK